MSRREKIIVSVMVLAVIYGAYNLFFTGNETGSRKAATNAAQEAVELVELVTPGLTKNGALSATAPYIIEKTLDKWPDDPFLDYHLALKLGKQETAANDSTLVIPGETLGFTYSGYLLVGDNILAIINGLEYGVGEQLRAEGDYVVEKITPSQVTLNQRGTQTKVILNFETIGQ